MGFFGATKSCFKNYFLKRKRKKLRESIIKKDLMGAKDNLIEKIGMLEINQEYLRPVIRGDRSRYELDVIYEKKLIKEYLKGSPKSRRTQLLRKEISSQENIDRVKRGLDPIL